MKPKQKSNAAAPPLAARIQSLASRLESSGLCALLITHPPDIRYLTGFIGEDSWALIPLRGRDLTPWILTDFRFQEQVGREAPQAQVFIRRQSLPLALAELMRQRKDKRVGLQPQHVSLALRKELNKAVSAKAFKPVKDMLLEQRSVKDLSEIKSIRKAILIQQQACAELLSELQTGLAEQEIAAFLEYRMRTLGAEGSSFPIVAAVDANAALPHAVAGSRRLRQGSLLLLDFGGRVNGYCSDMTRCYAMGRMKRKLREIYQIVLDAQMAAIAAVKPGIKLADLDAVARSLIAKAGYGEQFGHSLGHGIGLQIHEFPAISSRAKGRLMPGQVITIEPGIYLPGIGGVRIEDDVLVTDRGGQVLSDLPKDLDSAII